MCILFIALNQHPEYPLILCANRDEFRARKTQQMHWWSNKNLLAGKDMQAGGSWLTVTPDGDIAALTNIREPQKADNTLRSRGELVLKVNKLSASALATDLTSNRHHYQGFNLIYSKDNAFTCFNSRQNQFIKFTDGIHSVCNGALDDEWPKMAKGKKALESYICEQPDINHSALLNLLKDTRQAPDELLPSTGVPIDWERRLSSIFILGEEYGTRSSCIVTRDKRGKINVTEANYNANAELVNTVEFSWLQGDRLL
ncbi:NRDE family protein [Thalassotalea euphylliae]|uniref:NRDE family protein n=1 Tax=Thalassotalea euphylliae TaxID=1655234 RepID=UPI003645B532